MKMKIEPRRTKFVLVLSILSIALISGTGLAQQHDRRPPVASSRPSMIDAFLDNPVDSTDELVAVLQKNKKLRQRYSKHFNIPEDRIIDFVKNTLIVDRIKKDRVVTNYCITKTGRVYALHQTFKKGTKVWALRDGTPILRWACANPLAKRLPIALTSRRPRLSPTPEVAGQRPRVAESAPDPVIPDVEAGVPVIAPQEPLLANVENLAAPANFTGAASAISGGITIPGRFPLLPLTAITLPLINSLTRPGNNVVTPVVPEPGTMLLMAASLPVIAAIRTRRRKISACS